MSAFYLVNRREPVKVFSRKLAYSDEVKLEKEGCDSGGICHSPKEAADGSCSRENKENQVLSVFLSWNCQKW